MQPPKAQGRESGHDAGPQASRYFLQTRRLGFRLWADADLDLALALWSNAEVTRLIGGPFSRQQVQERLAREMATMQAYRIQYWPIFLLETGDHLGCCGLRPYLPEENRLEIGFHLHERYWGQGYATEAAQAVMGYAFNVLGAAGLFAGHNPANQASRQLLMKLGFRYTHDEYYAPTGLNHPSYELTAQEFARISKRP